MGSSSTGKKHKKDKKRKRSYGDGEIDLTADGYESSSGSQQRQSGKHKRHKEHREHKHKHRDRERVREHDRERQKDRYAEVIAVQESDSDSSDCVEVPLDNNETVKQSKDRDVDISAPPPPQLSRQEIEREREKERLREREERDKIREKERVRERELQREYEREKEREREQRYRERREREAERDYNERERDREREREKERDRNERIRHRERYESSRSTNANKQHSRSNSPIPENGSGDVLSIEETNKLRAKLGLKPLEIDSKPTTSTQNNDEKAVNKFKDEWGEFLHKPAGNLGQKTSSEKLRDKLKARRDKRSLEERLARIKTLGESDDEIDDANKWVQRNKTILDEKKAAEKRAKALEEFDAELEANPKYEYKDKDLKGLHVDHDVEDFTEGKTVILTLKDNDVLDEEANDTLVNVNMVDNERYRVNIKNKKANSLKYGYDVYEEQFDEFGNPLERSVLSKYDEDLDGVNVQKRKDFVIGEQNIIENRKQKLEEIRNKLAGKRLETLLDAKSTPASEVYTEKEMEKFKKPKKRRVKKLRTTLKAEDLLPLAEDNSDEHFGNREVNAKEEKTIVKDFKFSDEDDNELERMLAKARRLKQIENIIQKPLITNIKQEVKVEKEEPIQLRSAEGNIIINSTAEFCRTLGDIPTYGSSGNRIQDGNEILDYDEQELNENGTNAGNELRLEPIEQSNHGTWNSVNPDEVMQPADLDHIAEGVGVEERAILDEEPDVGAGVANALRLALSKGYLEREEHNRPSNSKMAHLQAKNYSIEDKSAADDDKFGRRDRFHAGPIIDFKDKESFKPNVKLEYIDDSGRILNLKEAFRYLSHKFHGKGPGKNKIEKRLKKMEQDGLMKTMSSTDTPLGTLTMLQQKQKETKTPYVVLSGGKQSNNSFANSSISKYK